MIQSLAAYKNDLCSSEATYCTVCKSLALLLRLAAVACLPARGPAAGPAKFQLLCYGVLFRVILNPRELNSYPMQCRAEMRTLSGVRVITTTLHKLQF
jgi:hypothetical protein